VILSSGDGRRRCRRLLTRCGAFLIRFAKMSSVPVVCPVCNSNQVRATRGHVYELYVCACDIGKAQFSLKRSSTEDPRQQPPGATRTEERDSTGSRLLPANSGSHNFIARMPDRRGPRCPACHSEETERLPFLADSPQPIYSCHSCGYAWREPKRKSFDDKREDRVA